MQHLANFRVSLGRAVVVFFALTATFVLGPSFFGGSSENLVTTDDVTPTSTSNPAQGATEAARVDATLPSPGVIEPNSADPATQLAIDQASEVAVAAIRSGSSSKQAEPPPTEPAEAPPEELDTSGWKSFDEMNVNDYSVSSALISGTGQPGSARFACFASHFNYDDPIVAPNQPGAAHLHMFLGNTLADNSSTFESLSRTGDGTCSGSELNRSAYWVPALIDTRGQARIPQYSLIYYKAGPMTGQTISPLPDNLKMIAGNARATTPGENDGVHKWYCGFPGNYPTYYNESQVIPACNPGDAITLSLVFPQCWDGVNLDSKNHRDHMAYPDGRSCPASHPVIIPQITYNIYWNNSDMSTAGWYLSSDKHGGLDVAGGTTTHGDWFGAWHPDVMTTFINQCNNQGHDCQGATISPSQRLVTSGNTGVSDGQDIYNGFRSPQFVAVDAI